MTVVQFETMPTAQLIRSDASDVGVVLAARVSAVDEQVLSTSSSPNADTKLIDFLMRDRHGSPFEHNSMTFFVHAPIFVLRELMRHRIASYNEESGRFRTLKPVFYVPAAGRDLVQEGRPGRYDLGPGSPEQTTVVQECYKNVCETAYSAYEEMLQAGVAREVARGVLPLTIFSTAYVTINARSLMNLLSLRVRSKDSTYPSYAQREIEIVAEAMEKEWANLMPHTYKAFVAAGRVAP